MNKMILHMGRCHSSISCELFCGLLLVVWSLIFPTVGFGEGLPVEIELDRFMMAAGKNLEENRLKKVEFYLQKIESLRADPPALYHYYKARTFRGKGQLGKEKNHLETYVSLAGKQGEHYESALVRITQLEEAMHTSGSVSKNAKSSEALLNALKQDKDSDDKKHADKLKSLYLKNTYNTALVAHINELLATYAFTGKRLTKSDVPPAVIYQISISDEDAVVVQRRDKASSPETLTRDTFIVYGKDSFLNHDCSYQNIRCTIKHPDNYRDWFVISYNKEAAAELVSSLSRLIRNMQVGKGF